MVPNNFYRLLKRVIPYVFWFGFFVTIVLTLMPGNQIPKDLQFWDKAEHALIFFFLMFTGGIAYSHYRYIMAVGLVFYGAAIEIMQEYFTTSRNGDKFDIVADAVGVLIGFALFWLLYKLTHKPREAKN